MPPGLAGFAAVYTSFLAPYVCGITRFSGAGLGVQYTVGLAEISGSDSDSVSSPASAPDAVRSITSLQRKHTCSAKVWPVLKD